MASKDRNLEVSATLYEQLSSHQKEVGQKLVTLSMIKSGNSILDFGCGTGYLTAILSELVGPEGKVVGVDPDSERIKMAKKNYSRPNILYIVGDDQTFPEDQYDVVFANHVLPRIKQKGELFKRIYQNLHPEGRFAFLTFNGPPGFPPVMVKAFNELIGPDFLENLLYKDQCFEVASTYKELAISTGFEVSHIETKACEEKWESVDKFLAYFHGISHGEFNMSSISEESLKSFKKDYEEELVSQSASRTMLYITLTKKLR